METGLEVVWLLKTFKKIYPEKIPTKPGEGLLAMGPVLVNDFELALHLLSTGDAAMKNIVKGETDVPVLLAYLAVVTVGNDLPDEYLLESALPFVVQLLTLESEAEKRWHLELKTEIVSEAKRRSARNAGNASMPRHNARTVDHDDLRNEYRRLVQEGHTNREARGILVQRGNMGSQATIHRITREM